MPKNLNQNLTVNMGAPGIKLYIEEPEVVIQREIRRAVWIVAAVLVIAAILIMVAVFKIKQMTPRLTGKQNTIYSTLQSNVIDSELLNNWEEIQPILVRINQALPDPTNLLDYQAALEKAGQDAGVQIAVNFNTTASTTSKVSTTSVIEHQVQTTGDLENIIQFLANVEEMPYYVELTKFTITPASSAKKEASVNLSLKLYAAAKGKTQNLPSASPSANNLEIK